jgi:hypothetical protein
MANELRIPSSSARLMLSLHSDLELFIQVQLPFLASDAADPDTQHRKTAATAYQVPRSNFHEERDEVAVGIVMYHDYHGEMRGNQLTIGITMGK